jgi:hypothetical protein
LPETIHKSNACFRQNYIHFLLPETCAFLAIKKVELPWWQIQMKQCELKTCSLKPL